MGGTGFLRALLLALLAAVHTDASHLPPTSWASVEGPPGVAAHFQSPTEWLEYLYRKHRVAVQEMREYVRGWADETGLHQGVGDIEAEVIYLRIRELRPENVAEYGFGQGLTTVYILCALRDNGKGTLHSFDKLDKHGRVDKVPAGLAASRWVFHLGDARSTSPLLGVDFDYIHSDAQHSVQFAQWLAAHDLAKRTELHVSFHDAFVKEGLLHAGAKGSGGVTPEAMVVLKWLGANPRRVRHVYSFAESHFGTLFREAARARKGAGLDERWIATKPTTFNQPSVFFTLKP